VVAEVAGPDFVVDGDGALLHAAIDTANIVVASGPTSII
jgi:hypothetical protein